jgi:glycosyltransferase involved in cell wall biosynthesis
VQLWSPGLTGFGGGIGAFSLELAMGLKALGHEVGLGGLVDRSGPWGGCAVFGAGAAPGWARRVVFAGQCLGRAGLDRPQEIVCTHLNLGPLALVGRWLCGARTTLVAHGVDVHPGLSSWRLRALRRATRLVAVSAWTRQRLLGLGGIDPERVRLLANTFDETRFRVGPRPVGLAARLGLATGERVILTVARLDPGEGYKGYDRVVLALPEVVRACGPVRLLVVGRGADGERLRALARARGVEDRLLLAGFVPDSALPDYYRLADVFAMPSTGEGFGIVFLEAMACGTPVLAGNRDGSVDAVAGGRLGALVNPLAVDAIAAGLIGLLRREGPAVWFDREALSLAAGQTFGRTVFRARLRDLVG